MNFQKNGKAFVINIRKAKEVDKVFVKKVLLKMRNDLEKDVYKVEVATVFNNMDKKVSKA